MEETTKNKIIEINGFEVIEGKDFIFIGNTLEIINKDILRKESYIKYERNKIT